MQKVFWPNNEVLDLWSKMFFVIDKRLFQYQSLSCVEFKMLVSC